MYRCFSPTGDGARTSVIQLSERRNYGKTACTARLARPAPEKYFDETPTLFLDFDWTLHIGRASMDEQQRISLNTGRRLFEFAPLLIKLLEPYPSVQLVLTTSWLMTLPVEEVVHLMPPELACRVVDTTRRVKPRLSYLLNGTDRTYVISYYATSKRLKHWLALDDAVFGGEQFGRTRGELAEHFLLLHPSRGLSDNSALQRIGGWLAEVHS
ncbi:hypothetical protein KTE13_20350 [Burkholderia multivorans]|uniref:Uncharacterized protein n=2 Tax=Burkholderia cepacia complex TaxID=87882 RepID=A4JA86_BURVG|nr:HAD domain-containing protein [Burkholderia multivorans]ABO53189.1 hypothetical protein Bcep1808_0166 [Burkholderia vietnamiensis G4]MBU9402095.1 hypothetical protein [Burkholderia multivorans]